MFFKIITSFFFLFYSMGVFAESKQNLYLTSEVTSWVKSQEVQLKAIPSRSSKEDSQYIHLDVQKIQKKKLLIIAMQSKY